MSSGCGDVLSLADLQTAKKHQTFEAEVITGKAGGVSSGADIDYATNQVTGQVQKTLPAVLRDAGFRPASFTFDSGGTLGVNDADLAVLWPGPSGDGNYYAWKGALPKTIPAGSTPSSTGGVGPTAWVAVSEAALRADLAKVTGATLIGKSGGGTIQDALNDMLSNSALKGRLVFANKDGLLDNTGVSDISSAVLSFLNANKGKYIIFEAGTYKFSNVELSGSGWDGTVILFQGVHLLSANPASSGPWSGLILSEGVQNLTLYYRGNGNRTAQPDQEHHFNLVYQGCKNIRTITAEITEVRGDGIYVNRNPTTFTNSSNLYFGYVHVYNSSLDGRNGMSVVSCDGGHVDYFRSDNVGAVVGGFQQPGGFDIEPNVDAGFTFLVRSFSVDYAVAVNSGSIGIVGKTANGYLVRDCHIKQAHIRNSGGSLRVQGCRDSSVTGTVENTSSVAAYISEAFRCKLDVTAINCTFATYVGHTGDVSDCSVKVVAGGMTNSGVAVGSATKTNFDIDIQSFNTTTPSNFIGLWARNIGNISGSQWRDCTFKLNCPAGSGAIKAMEYFTGASSGDVVFNGVNSIVSGSCFSGYSTFAAVTGGLGQYLRKDQNITGLNIIDTQPLTSGSFRAGDIVIRSALSGTTYGYYRATTGSSHVIGTDWRTLNVT